MEEMGGEREGKVEGEKGERGEAPQDSVIFDLPEIVIKEQLVYFQKNMLNPNIFKIHKFTSLELSSVEFTSISWTEEIRVDIVCLGPI